MCDSGGSREKLIKLIEIKDSEQRAKQLVLLLEQKLKQHPNWFLIYDNVETFRSIQPYFPCNSKAWGNGRVIITTKDINIKNNSHIKNSNVIEIEELSTDEKYQLFLSIVERGSESSRESPYEHSLSRHRTCDVAYGGFSFMFTKSFMKREDSITFKPLKVHSPMYSVVQRFSPPSFI